MEPDPAPEFTPADVNAVHRAVALAEEKAKEREVAMPSSSLAFRRHADQLKSVRDKILSLLPPSIRRSYPR